MAGRHGEVPTWLIVAASARALAESAARSRRRPRLVAIDLFGDRDLRALARWHPPVGRRSTLRGCLAAAARLLAEAAGGCTPAAGSCGRAALSGPAQTRRSGGPAAPAGAAEDAAAAVLPGGGTEHFPRALAALAARAPLLASPPEAIAAVRDPYRLFTWLAEAGIAHPRTWLPPARPPAGSGGLFLLKPLNSGAGRGIRPWVPGRSVPAGYLVQARLEPGTPVGAAALADGRRACLLGLAVGLAGEPALGAHGFAYAGSLLGPVGGDRYPELATEAAGIADRLAAAFCLRGLFGVDFVLHSGRLHLLEVNPRYTASMELIEEATGESVVDLHLDALDGCLPADPAPWRRFTGGTGFWGKGVVYATAAAVAPDTDRWLEAGWRDVPVPGTLIPAGAPICTVFARGNNADACLSALWEEAAAVRAALSAAGAR